MRGRWRRIGLESEPIQSSTPPHPNPLPGGEGTRFAIYAAMWIVAIVSSSMLDARVAVWMRAHGVEQFLRSHANIRELLKLPGEYRFTVVVAIIAAIIHREHLKCGLFVLLATLVSGVNGAVKWIVGRTRPYKLHEDLVEPFVFNPFRGGIPGAFDAKNLCFPSGHAALAFATAASLAILWPRFRLAFYALASVVAIERFAENAHWLSDTVAAAALGIAGVHLIRWIWWDGAQRERIDDREVDRFQARIVNRQVSSMAEDQPYLSLVIPCFNEQESVPTLLQRVEESLSRIGKPFEVLIIDDGSTDQSPRLLAQAMATRPWLRILRMKKNGGQSAAFEAGFEAARGEIIATIDADLQNDPEEIPRLLPLLEGYDMITGWRKERQDTAFRRWQSRQANRIRNWITGETVQDSASSLKIYRSHAIKGLKLFRGAHRYFPTLVKLRGYTAREEPVKHSQRFAGTAKYGFANRAFVGIVDLFGVRWMKKRYLRYEVSEIQSNNKVT